jgi:hypothetical protein
MRTQLSNRGKSTAAMSNMVLRTTVAAAIRRSSRTSSGTIFEVWRPGYNMPSSVYLED